VTANSLADACSSNYAAAFAALVPHSGNGAASRRRFGAVDAIATGIPIAFYNPIMVVTDGARVDDADQALGWITSLGLPASAQVREDLAPQLDAMFREWHLEPEVWLTPGMAMSPVPPGPEPSRELHIERVTPETFDDWHTGIDYGERFRRTWVPSLVNDAAFVFLVGYHGGRPVTGAAAVLDHTTVGVYAVGTVENRRGRGFGTAITWAAVRAGVEAGASTVVLQSSEDGLGVYRAMGFQTVCRYVEYMPAPRDA
jgi:ribosomal protein S18 acetylase RimI-like enzyme